MNTETFHDFLFDNHEMFRYCLIGRLVQWLAFSTGRGNSMELKSVRVVYKLGKVHESRN